jgi:hypothetical protein
MNESEHTPAVPEPADSGAAAERAETPRVLTRLLQLGLIEEIADDSDEEIADDSDEETADDSDVWQLTARGKELGCAIPHEHPDAGC